MFKSRVITSSILKSDEGFRVYSPEMSEYYIVPGALRAFSVAGNARRRNAFLCLLVYFTCVGERLQRVLVSSLVDCHPSMYDVSRRTVDSNIRNAQRYRGKAVFIVFLFRLSISNWMCSLNCSTNSFVLSKEFAYLWVYSFVKWK